jgi:lysophospholipase L1-like esterase
MAQILIFGDSIAYGAWDAEGGWAARLRRSLDQKRSANPEHYFLVYNLGISGDTAEGILERFEFEASQRIDEQEETIFIFAIGINDSQFIHSQNDLRYSAPVFQRNIQQLIRLAKKYSSKIIFVGLTPVDEAQTAPLAWNKAKSCRNQDIQRNNEIIKNVCSAEKVYFIEILEKLLSLDYKKLLDDGLHPNSEGHKKIFELVKNFLIENKII